MLLFPAQCEHGSNMCIASLKRAAALESPFLFVQLGVRFLEMKLHHFFDFGINETAPFYFIGTNETALISYSLTLKPVQFH